MQVNRCMNCMEEINGTGCTHCGFDMTRMVPEPYCLRPNTILKGRYLIGRSIGRGGFGITYIGFDLVLDIKVAVKEYFPSGQASRDSSRSNSLRWNIGYNNQEQWQRGCDDSLREARKMAKISTIPSIVRVMDTFTENSTAYIVMEYVEGVSLKQYLEQKGLMSFQNCVKLLKPLIMGLEKAHQQGLIHRDISPDNIMVKKDGSVCLLDLGAAKDLSASNRAVSKLVTKNGFSPLEQYSEAGGIGPWTDVYAMCATIYYCLTGKKPQDALDRMEKDELNLDIIQLPLTPGQRKALSGGLALRRQDRIQDMGQLLKALESGKPAVPVWVRPLAVAATAVLVCVIGGLVWTNFFREKERATGEEEMQNNQVASTEVYDAVRVEYQGISNSTLTAYPSYNGIVDSWEYYTDADLNLYISQYNEGKNTFYIGTDEAVDSEVSSVNVGDEYVYYIRGDSDEGLESIVQMNYDGSGQTALISYYDIEWLQYVRLSDERTYLYYQVYSDDEQDGGRARLYRYDLKTGEDECILDCLIFWYSLYDEYLYYVEMPASLTDYSEILLMRADVDGCNSEILDDDYALCYGFVDDKMLYLVSPEMEIAVICDLDGKILDNKLGDLQTVLYSSCFAYGDGWIYYSPSGSGELHKVLTDGSHDTVIYQGSEILDMCYYYGWLLVVTGDIEEGTTGAFMIDKNGSDEIINVGASRTGDGYVYEYSDGGVKLVGYEGEESDVVIPDTVYGMEVVSVEWSSILNDQANFYILNEDVQYMLMKKSELTWEEAEDGTGVVITSYSGEVTGSCEWVAIPSEIDGQTVVAIGDEAMQNLGVKGLFLPEGLVEIRLDAFADCDSLVNIIFPETLTSIDRGAFVFCDSLKSVVLPDSLETLGIHAFAFDTALEEVYIPANLSSVSGMNPFYGCPLLSISISDENTSYQVIDGVLFTADGRELVSYPAGSTATSYTVPDGVKVIGNAAFYGAQNLEKVILPEGLQTVTANAFMNCAELETINIPDSVTMIGKLSFSGCSSLTEISVPSDAQVSEDVGVSVTER